MLTDTQLKVLKPAAKMYKVSDRRGVYVAATSTGFASGSNPSDR